MKPRHYPELNKEDKRVSISSVVLSSQRVELNQALFDAAKAKDRQKKTPSTHSCKTERSSFRAFTRVFSTAREIYVYFQAYKAVCIQPAPAVPAGNPPLFRICYSLSRKASRFLRRSRLQSLQRSKPPRNNAAKFQPWREWPSRRTIRLPGSPSSIRSPRRQTSGGLRILLVP